MIALFLFACELPTVSPDAADSAALDSADPVEAAVTMETCLANGGSLVERAASEPWAVGLVDLELSADGAIYALTDDGHLLVADPADPTAWTDLGTRGSDDRGGALIDVAGETVLMNFDDTSVGTREEALGDWRTVHSGLSETAISPDGETMAWVSTACGLSWGVDWVADDEDVWLDYPVFDSTPTALEFLDDGRLVAASWDGTGNLFVFDGTSLQATYPLGGSDGEFAPLETLGELALTATLGDREAGTTATLERLDLGNGLHTSVSLPFTKTAQVALSGALSWALGTDGELVATDGTTLFELGTQDGVTDLVADPDEDWLATAGEDGVLRVYGCE